MPFYGPRALIFLISIFLLIITDHFALSLQNPPIIADPCQLPSPATASALSPFCQFHYHQIPYICDPAGTLSRTEAELIDRRLQRDIGPVNLTGCLCANPDFSSPSSSSPSRRCSHPAWKDKKLGQLRLVVLLVPRASINGIRKCAKSSTDRPQTGGGRIDTGGFSTATAQFARDTLKRLVRSGEAEEQRREQCDPDLLIIYIQGWTSANNVQVPFVARLFRRNLAHLAHESQVERIDRTEAGVFEVLSEQLSRALRLARGNAPLARPAVRPRHRALPPPPAINNPSSPASHLSADQQQLSDQLDEDQDDDRPRAEQIPLWAILISLTLLSMALLAVLMAHWVGRRMSANHQQKKFGPGSRLNGAGGSIHRQETGKISHSSGHSVTFAVAERGGAEGGRSGGGGGGGRSGGGGGGGGHHHHQMKGSMMFRQFSRRYRSHAGGAGDNAQKI